MKKNGELLRLICAKREVTSKEQKRAEQLLQSQHIGLHQIKSFSFMKRYHQVPRKSNLAAKDKYGPGILTLHLKEGKEWQNTL